MTIIEPIEILDSMIGSGAGTVSEVEHPEWAGGSTYNALQKVIVKGTANTFTDLGTGNKNWTGIAAAPNGDVYACEYNLSIWKQTGGVGLFVDLVAGNKAWIDLAAAPNGDIYAAVDNGSIWKQTGGTGAFTDLATGNKTWRGVAAAPNGDIYATVSAASIWKQTGGTGAFVDLGADAGNKNWIGITAAPNGDVYASVDNGSIWKRTGGAGAFADLVAGNKEWRGMAAATNGDIYVGEKDVSIWKQTGGVGAFVDLVAGNKYWESLAVAPGGDAFGVYATVYGGGIWVSTFEVIHKIYESLIAGNIGYYPPIDVRQTTPKWLEVSSTNKWKCFDGKVTDQMEAASGSVYTITPGVAHDSIALLNVEATTVRVQGTSGAYDTSVSTGATDIILTNLGGLAANVLTITITNTAGLAKCGEIVIGNYYTLGTMKPLPTVGIIDYSTKEQDAFGDWTIIPRSYSEKMSCLVNVTYSSLDAVIAKLKDYRTTPLVWVGNTGYACTILFGYLKDWSVPVATRGKAILSLEIEGLT
jgi:hypothetical protein